MIGHSYFRSPDNLLAQGWIRASWAKGHCYTNFFPGRLAYYLVGNDIDPCYRIIAVLDVLHCLITTIFLAPLF